MPSPQHRIAATAITAVALGACAAPALASSTAQGAPAPSPAARTSAATDPLAPLPGGTIYVENETIVNGADGHPFTLDKVVRDGHGPVAVQTTSSSAAQFTGDHRPALSGTAFNGGTEEVYSPSTNSIYGSSIRAPYLHRARHGHFTYRYGTGAPVRGTCTVTAAQAPALRQGRDSIDGQLHVTRPPSSYPTQVLSPRQAIQQGRFTAAGTTTLRIRRLPVNSRTDRLLSLSSVHRRAKIDSTHSAYVHAVGKLTVYDLP